MSTLKHAIAQQASNLSVRGMGRGLERSVGAVSRICGRRAAGICPEEAEWLPHTELSGIPRGGSVGHRPNI